MSTWATPDGDAGAAASLAWLTADGVDEADRERWARIAWSRLTEPLSEPAYRQIVQHGHVHGLRRLVSGRDQVSAAALARLDTFDLERELKATRAARARVVIPGDAEWPSGLDDLEQPPHCLWVAGDGDLVALTRRSASIVGARNATAYGEHLAAEIAYGLVDRGFTIVSGAAFGIDAAAHRGALAAGGGTVAALACGIDRHYPAAHALLIQEIAERGAIVSEVPPGSAPLRARFLARNRLIAAMTGGTVVVEAGLRSGSLNTAGWALGCGRSVAAVPGPVTSMTSAGTHEMIRDHRAELVTDAAEVAELLGDMGKDLAPQKRGPETVADGLPPRERALWQAMPAVRSATPEALCRSAGMSMAEVQASLGGLQLKGLVITVGLGWARVRPPR